MKKIKWAILLYGLGISGGANVIFEHALYAFKRGVEITFVSKEQKNKDSAAWHDGTENFVYKTISEASVEKYDVAIATEWRSAFDIHSLRADKYIYFVQSIESRFFYNQESMLAYIANNSYEINMEYITEARWIQEYLKVNYDKDSILVHNGIDKEIFQRNGKFIEPKNEKIRVLVEGSVTNWLKNVPRTIELCHRAGVEELWLVTPDKVDNYPGIDKLFCQVPFKKMPEIYRSCDILVKLSLVEGMFGPPLEMFHCGGTAITYNINGAEEYLIDGYNSIVIETGNEQGVVESLNKLINDRERLTFLKENAGRTAGKWEDWEQSSSSFWNAIQQIANMDKGRVELIKKKAKAGADAYRFIEENLGIDTCENRIKHAVDELKKNKKKLYIYGAGYLCKSAVIQFSRYDVIIEGIIVSDIKNNSLTVMGHPVYELTELSECKEAMYIYISTEKYRDEIISILKKEEFNYFI